MSKAGVVLDDCQEILRQRGEQYGDSKPLYTAIASMWSAYTGSDISAADVCVMMALMKIGRLSQGVDDPNALHDTYVDAINYIALARGLD